MWHISLSDNNNLNFDLILSLYYKKYDQNIFFLIQFIRQCPSGSNFDDHFIAEVLQSCLNCIIIQCKKYCQFEGQLQKDG